MCGLAGIVDLACETSSDALSALVSRMAGTLTDRGPDDSGVWVDPACGVALGHRRLSILDVSLNGHQPMVSHDGRYVLAYNGEIYNFRSLRAKLEALGHKFRGGSDTEVLLEAISEWGVGEALTQLNGMFAFAVVDTGSRTLTLARDRFGEKPLYYGHFGNILLFGSELRALRVHPSFAASLDRDAIGTYFLRDCIPALWTVYEGVSKLPPASLVTVPLGVGRIPAVPTQYWDALDVAQRAQADPFTGTFRDASAALGELLGDAVALRMESDVPLGAFLSGGCDSTSVAALMQEASPTPIRTFTIGYDNEQYDESRYARAIADHLGTAHTELRLSPSDALRAIPEMPKVYDEPFSDSSQLPTYLLSRLASDHVTVALSGDGGDELFGGYNRHVWVAKSWGRVQAYPRPVRRALASDATALSPAAWERVARVAPRGLRSQLTMNKISKLAQVVSAKSPADAYMRLISHWPTGENPVLGGVPYRGVADSFSEWPDLGGITEQMMALDSVSYLPDDILVKVDRASMAHSLETRVPMLDHRIYEFAWSLRGCPRVRGF
jgi:asparagine synthase (glutamine-hydrolysing)